MVETPFHADSVGAGEVRRDQDGLWCEGVWAFSLHCANMWEVLRGY
jgi:hypothetical protein